MDACGICGLKRHHGACVSALKDEVVRLTALLDAACKTNNHVRAPTCKTNSEGASSFDRAAYQREYMRARRAGQGKG